METFDLTELFKPTDQNTEEQRRLIVCLSASLTKTQGEQRGTHQHTNDYTTSSVTDRKSGGSDVTSV